MVYEVEKEDEVIEDIGILAEGLKLLEYDYIGGSGSRGYGKIAFENLKADVVVGQVDETIMKKCNELLNF
jgi:CRISPR-associated protein Csm3